MKSEKVVLSVEVNNRILSEGKLERLKKDINSLACGIDLFVVKQKVGLNKRQIQVMLELKSNSGIYNKYESPVHAYMYEKESIDSTFESLDQFYKAWFIGYFDIDELDTDIQLF